MLNSLYGRFGRNPDSETHVIIDSSDSKIISHQPPKGVDITNVINLGNNKELISYVWVADGRGGATHRPLAWEGAEPPPRP